MGMRLADYWESYWISRRFSCYRPRKPTQRSVLGWLEQFTIAERKLLVRLVRHVRYITESEFIRLLLKENARLLDHLRFSGLTNKQIIYAQFDDAGSSSGVALNLLRDRGLLERMGYHWINYRSVNDLVDLTTKISEGAIIYVDDFIGTGKQFEKSHKFCSPYIQGRFSQFLLAGCICEEAFKILYQQNVAPFAPIIHSKKERPLLTPGVFSAAEIAKLENICLRVANNGTPGLGYDRMASMVVLYRNAPNNTPFAVRGTIGQQPFVGILPRTTDLISRAQAAGQEVAT